MKNYIEKYLIRNDGNINAAFTKTDKWKQSKEKIEIEELTKHLELSFIGKLDFLLEKLVLKPCKNCGIIVTKSKGGNKRKPNEFCSKSCATSYNKIIKSENEKRNIQRNIKHYLKENDEIAFSEIELIKILKKKKNQGIIPFLLNNKIYNQVMLYKKENEDLEETLFKIKNKIKKRPKCYCGNEIVFSKGAKKYYKTCSNKCGKILEGCNNDIEKAKNYIISDFKLYSKITRTLTEKQPIHLLENYDKRGRVDEEGSYHLDHKMPVKYGFDNGILPYVIADIRNLEMIPAIDNIKKGSSYKIL